MKDFDVTNHAIQRYRQRFNVPDANDVQVANVLIEVLKGALASQRFSDIKPVQFRVWGDRNGRLDPGHRIAWSEDKRAAVIYVENGEGYAIITTLSRAASRGMDRHVLKKRGRT